MYSDDLLECMQIANLLPSLIIRFIMQRDSQEDNFLGDIQSKDEY